MPGGNKYTICKCLVCMVHGGKHVRWPTAKAHREFDRQHVGTPIHNRKLAAARELAVCDCPQQVGRHWIRSENLARHLNTPRNPHTSTSPTDDNNHMDLDESVLQNDETGFQAISPSGIDDDITFLMGDLSGLDISDAESEDPVPQPGFHQDLEDDQGADDGPDTLEDDEDSSDDEDGDDFIFSAEDIEYDPEFQDQLEWLKATTGVTREAIDRITKYVNHRYEAVNKPLPTLRRIGKKLQSATGIRTTWIDCCINSCMAYTGTETSPTTGKKQKDLDKCTHCGEDRYYAHLDAKGNKVPRKQYPYISLIDRLRRQYQYPSQAKKLSTYRHEALKPGHPEYKHVKEDYMQGKLYCEYHLEELKLFQEPTDIACAGLMDGFVVTNMKTHDTTPFIIVNLNLPPEERSKHENILCSLLIPGPKKYKDFDSFVHPLIEEFLLLDEGIDGVYNADTKREFKLKAWLLFICGDGPASADACGLKRPGVAMRPCHQCFIGGIQQPKEFVTSAEPVVPVPNTDTATQAAQSSADADGDADGSDMEADDEAESNEIEQLDTETPKKKKKGGSRPYYLPHTDDKLRNDPPLRTRVREMIDAIEARTESQTEKNTTRSYYGIVRKSIFTKLRSLHFCKSFPFDPMHCFLQNLFPMHYGFWSAKKLAVDNPDKRPAGYEEIPSSLPWYRIIEKFLEAMGAAMAKSRATTAADHLRSPRDIFKHFRGFKAKEWESFANVFAIPLLADKLPQEYIDNFAMLLKIWSIVSASKVTEDEIKELKALCPEFVRRYEELYYRGDPHRLPVCVMNVHNLIHLAQHLEELGPGRGWWCFTMEKYIGWCKPFIKSKSQIDKSLANGIIKYEHMNSLALASNEKPPEPEEDPGISPEPEEPGSPPIGVGQVYQLSKTSFTGPDDQLIRKSYESPDALTCDASPMEPPSANQIARYKKLKFRHNKLITSEDGQHSMNINNRDNSTIAFMVPPWDEPQYGRVLAFFQGPDKVPRALVRLYQCRPEPRKLRVVFVKEVRKIIIMTSQILSLAGTIRFQRPKEIGQQALPEQVFMLMDGLHFEGRHGT